MSNNSEVNIINELIKYKYIIIFFDVHFFII